LLSFSFVPSKSRFSLAKAEKQLQSNAQAKQSSESNTITYRKYKLQHIIHRIPLALLPDELLHFPLTNTLYPLSMSLSPAENESNPYDELFTPNEPNILIPTDPLSDNSKLVPPFGATGSKPVVRGPLRLMTGWPEPYG
jgi:hypothetical protein